MAGPPLDAIEREQLCDLFLELGPEAPTMCDGWTTIDLAAHLVMREHDPRSGLAILGSSDRFAKLEERLLEKGRSRGYENLVARLRKGPPLVPWRVPGLRTPLNLNEWFVHHEDVRRADDRDPRSDVPELEAALWKLMGSSARLMVRGLKDAGLTLVAPDHGTREVRKRSPMVTLTGTPQELVLYLNGRRGVAQVELSGDASAVKALATAKLGV
jgi:uncharacterized protein (TIGR03085 family)